MDCQDGETQSSWPNHKVSISSRMLFLFALLAPSSTVFTAFWMVGAHDDLVDPRRVFTMIPSTLGVPRDDPGVVHHDHEEATLTGSGFDFQVLYDGCIMLDLAASTAHGKKLTAECVHTVAARLPGLLSEPSVQHSNFVQCADKFTQTAMCQRALLTMADRWNQMTSLQQDVYGGSTFVLAKKLHPYSEKWIPLLEVFTSNGKSFRAKWDRFRWKHKGRNPVFLMVATSVICAVVLSIALAIDDLSYYSYSSDPFWKVLTILAAIALVLTAIALVLTLGPTLLILACSPLRVVAGQAAQNPVMLATRYIIDSQQQVFAQSNRKGPSIFENPASVSAHWW
eukprot:842610-Amphidinium_carterae.1